MNEDIDFDFNEILAEFRLSIHKQGNLGYFCIIVPNRTSTNTIPTIWITNNIYSIDNAMVRRFDFSVEYNVPTKTNHLIQHSYLRS